MERTYKTWGEKWNIFRNDLCEVSYLDLKPGQRCSWHKHRAKFNLFFVIDGELYIKTEWGIAEIAEGEIFTTRPDEYHEFQTGKAPCRVIEVMFVRYDPEDIERKIEGGPLITEKDKVYRCRYCGKDVPWDNVYALFCDKRCHDDFFKTQGSKTEENQEGCKCQ